MDERKQFILTLVLIFAGSTLLLEVIARLVHMLFTG